MATDDQGQVVQSLSYDDYGLTRIAGESSAAAEDGMASFYRFQGQEQETFPLAKLGIDNEALAQWLDQIQLYHFPWRDYGAGLAVFTETDPIPRDDSLYAALGANPVNYADETGGMWGRLRDRFFPTVEYPRVYSPAHLRIPPEIQALLDRMERTPNIPIDLSPDEWVALRRVFARTNSQFENPNNPFMPLDGEDVVSRPIRWDEQSNSYRFERVRVNDEYRRDAQRRFDQLRQSQENWLRRYDRLIVNNLLYNSYRGAQRPQALEEIKEVKEESEQKEEKEENEQKEEKDANDQPADELVPLVLQDQGNIEQDTDEDVSIEVPHGGGDRQEVDEPALRPAREEDRPFRCCNIL
jgi:RHS repeat-associated protein